MIGGRRPRLDDLRADGRGRCLVLREERRREALDLESRGPMIGGDLRIARGHFAHVSSDLRSDADSFSGHGHRSLAGPTDQVYPLVPLACQPRAPPCGLGAVLGDDELDL